MNEEAPSAPARPRKPRSSPQRASKAPPKSWRDGKLMKRPVRTLATAAFGALLCGVAVNAIVLQSGHHPAPLFGPRELPARRRPAPPAPPIKAPVAPQPHPEDTAPTGSLPQVQAKPAPPPAPPLSAKRPKAAHEDVLGSFLARPAMKAAKPTAHEDVLGSFIAKEAPRAPAGGRVSSVQTALHRLGFSVKSSGKLDAPTRVALEKFEKSRSLPVKAELTPQVMRALAARSGVRIP